MMRREMVLNDSSVHAPSASRECVCNWLHDVAVGIAELQQRQVVGGECRLRKPVHETLCQPGFTLWDALVRLRQRHREESNFLAGLLTKTPLLAGVDAETESRYLGCEGLSLTSGEGAPLLLCAIMDSVAVGLPSEAVWDKDRVTVEFQELLPDASWREAVEDIDNLTRSVHANLIFERHQERLTEATDAASLWAKRRQIFPALVFGPGVEENLQKESRNLHTIIRKLIALDHVAAAWTEGPRPDWPGLVTDESDTVHRSSRLLARRRFHAQDGTTQLFTWHARFGGGGRIHLRFEGRTRKVEIGYIGRKLRVA